MKIGMLMWLEMFCVRLQWVL